MDVRELIDKIDLSKTNPLVKMGGESDGEGQDQTDRSNGSSASSEYESFWTRLLDLFGL